MAKRKKLIPPDDIDHKIRVNELKESIREVAGREMTGFTSDDCPPEVEEEFLRQVLEYESAPINMHTDQLKRDGIELPPASTLSAAQLSKRLNSLIQNLGTRRIFLYHTNHLTDRELYEWLREEGLKEQVPDMPPNPSYSYHLDVLGSYGEKEVFLYNKYYATNKERAKHRKEYPKEPLPPHEDPVADRDRTLPNCGF